MRDQADTYQAYFERRWRHLRRARVRALAWLLDAPDLLDIHDPHWEGRIATLGPMTPATERWLIELDADPAPLDAALGAKMYTRLGLYAEKLMAFYFAHQGRLVAHGLQVRASRNDTVGEFDFLLDAGEGGVEHIEFATKFYLLQGDSTAGFDTFVGPNLADSLGAKIHKIFDRQLALSAHPAAQRLLPQAVAEAQALVKGWLFYHGGERPAQTSKGVSAEHCHGFWCGLGQLAEAPSYSVLPRLSWLAPARAAWTDTLDRAELEAAIEAAFARERMPVLVARMQRQGDEALEAQRGFIVPEGWSEEANARLATVKEGS